MAEFVEIRLIVPGFLGLELGNLMTRKIMTDYLESLRNFHQTIILLLDSGLSVGQSLVKNAHITLRS